MVKTLKVRGHHLKALKLLIKNGTSQPIDVSPEGRDPILNEIVVYNLEQASLFRVMYKTITEDSKSKIRITYSPDSICLACPNFVENDDYRGCNRGEHKHNLLDKKITKEFGLKSGLYLSEEVVAKLKVNAD